MKSFKNLINLFFSVIITLSFLALPNSLNAQSFVDAMRYSQMQTASTARSLGVGGSLGALGADYSAIINNPAGLGLYRRSDFIFSPTFFSVKTEAELKMEEQSPILDETKTAFNFSSIGIVIATRPLSSKWKTFNFGLGLNRLANFHQEYTYEGTSKGSITDRFVELANGLTPGELDNFEAGPAYDVFAIDETEEGSSEYFNDFGANPDVFRRQTVISKGGINEIDFTFSANYDEKLMIGATVGIPIINYEYSSFYEEIDEEEIIEFFDELEFRDDFSTSGVGINLKMGLIYRFNQMVRMGLAFHTPTAMSLTDEFTTDISFTFDDDPNPGISESPIGNFDYRMNTPWRVMGSMGFVFQKMGFFHAEIEFLDYSSAKFNFTKDDPGYQADEDFANREIKTNLQQAVNLRFGGEFAYEVFRFRAGLGFNQSPLEGDKTLNPVYSAGLGLREKDFYLDLGYQLRTIKEGFIPYLLENRDNEQLVDLNSNLNKLVLTAGFRF